MATITYTHGTSTVVDDERGLVALLIEDPEPAWRAADKFHLRPHAFSDLVCQQVFRAAWKLREAGEMVSPLSLSRSLAASKGGEHFTVQYLCGLSGNSITHALNAETQAKSIAHAARRRAALEALEDVRRKVETTDDVETTLREGVGFLQNLQEVSFDAAAVLASYNFKPVSELIPGRIDDDLTLLGNRYLCRCGSLLLIGRTGIGKSSLALQMALRWAIGAEAFGIQPAKALKSVFVQAENDEGDLHEMKAGVIAGCGFSTEEQQLAESKVIAAQVDDRAGESLFPLLEALLEKHRPDLLWIDPLLSFAGCNLSAQAEITPFLRNQLQPLVNRYNCAVIILHHEVKPPKEEGNTAWATTDFAYAGAGSADMANWARAVLVVRPTQAKGVFELIGAKRGGRLNWLDEALEATCVRYIRHATDGQIYWREASGMDLAIVSRREKTVEDLLAHVPLSDVIPKSTLLNKVSTLPGHAKIGLNKARALLDEAITAGKLFEVRKTRSGTNAAILISRKEGGIL